MSGLPSEHGPLLSYQLQVDPVQLNWDYMANIDNHPPHKNKDNKYPQSV